MPDFNTGFVVLGALGGILPDAVRFAKKKEEGFPEWFRSLGYWAGLGVLVVLGGAAAWLGQAQDWQSAISMGFAAPEIISRLFGSESAAIHGTGNGFPLRRWWTK